MPSTIHHEEEETVTPTDDIGSPVAGKIQYLRTDEDDRAPNDHNFQNQLESARQSQANTAEAFNIMMDSNGIVDGGLSVGQNTLGRINA